MFEKAFWFFEARKVETENAKPEILYNFSPLLLKSFPGGKFI